MNDDGCTIHFPLHTSTQTSQSAIYTLTNAKRKMSNDTFIKRNFGLLDDKAEKSDNFF